MSGDLNDLRWQDGNKGGFIVGSVSETGRRIGETRTQLARPTPLGAQEAIGPDADKVHEELVVMSHLEELRQAIRPLIAEEVQNQQAERVKDVTPWKSVFVKLLSEHAFQSNLTFVLIVGMACSTIVAVVFWMTTHGVWGH